MRVAAGVEYDGSDFSGWQEQTGRRTVQRCLEQAIARVADHPVRIVTAGRTDAGVHASGQVFHFDSAAERAPHQWLRGVNTHLPRDVALVWVRPVPGDFHARFSATRRSYRYVILNRSAPSALFRHRAWTDYRALDVGAMRAAAACLVGEHDFSAFRAAGCQADSPVRRVLHLDVERAGAWICFDVSANAFLKHMVRNMIGTLTAVGAGEQPVGWVRSVLAGRDRRQAGVTAPPAGLYLTSVDYPARFDLPRGGLAVRYW